MLSLAGSFPQTSGECLQKEFRVGEARNRLEIAFPVVQAWRREAAVDVKKAQELEKMRNIIPFDQMTLEDLNEVFPETKLDKKKYPYWPHKPVESL